MGERAHQLIVFIRVRNETRFHLERMSDKIISPARANRAVRGGNIRAASPKAPPNRPHAFASCCGAHTRGAADKCWYGTPFLVSGGRHPRAQAGNDDEVNHNIFLYDRQTNKMLLDSCIGIATRLRDAVVPLEHLRDYGPQDSDRDMRILQDCQRVLSAFAWPVTDALNHLLAIEYVTQARHINNDSDISRLEWRRAAAAARSGARDDPADAGSAQPAPAKKRKADKAK
jgi:hypothetical protein